jgi:sugar phosphate isomerase/epimerase
MKISNNTYILEERFGPIGAVRKNCEAGFEAIDYTMYQADGIVFERGGLLLAREMRRVAEGLGACFNQAHAPFSSYKLGAEYREHNQKIYYDTVKSIEIAAELMAPIIVIHPAEICPHLTADERFDMNMEVIVRLLEVARRAGVQLAIENIYARHRDLHDKIIGGMCSTAGELIRYLDAMPGACACLDIGHAGLCGERADGMIRTLADRIGTLHIHDNDFFTDAHTLPFLGKVNFDAITSALAAIGYRGDLSMETQYFTRNFPDEVIPAALALEARVCAYLRDEICRKCK